MASRNDLTAVKAQVKAWEKAFKNEHGRDPTKADIKTDRGHIAEQYALYRQLSKASNGDSKSSSASQAGPSRRNSRLAADPLTPTQPRRRSSTHSSLPSPPPGPLFPIASSSVSTSTTTLTVSKRSAPPSTPQRSKRPRGPVSDPNPNPFSVTPKKPALPAPEISSPFKASPFKAFSNGESPFIHVRSPKHLKELLKQSSKKDFTPRTRARKRLAGEAIDDTPVKSRKRRGTRDEEVFADAVPTDDMEEDEELDETPVKGTVFSLFDGGAKPDKGKGRDLFASFKRAKAASPEPKLRSLQPMVQEEVRVDEPDIAGAEEMEAGPSSTGTPRRDRAHIVQLSDDEFDPEGSPRTLTITGTKRRPIKVRPNMLAINDDFDELGDSTQDESEEEQHTDELLSTLSLRSPMARQGERLADLRVRALLDPTSAAAVALKARLRGQDVYVAGEGGWDDDEDEIVPVTVEGDDDWESDPEGWKATPGEDEEEW